jgi:hypothetical protein
MMDHGTCARCGANMRSVRVDHVSAVKGADDCSDVVACTNERYPDYLPGDDGIGVTS